MSFAVEYLNEYPLRWRDLARLTDDQKAAIAMVSYAASEINVLMRMYIFAAHGLIKDDPINYAILIQEHVALRNWSARLFEFVEFIKLGGAKKFTKDQTVLRLAEEALAKFSTLCAQEGYEIARDIRNEATSHYSLKAAVSNLKYVSDTANCSMYLHRKHHNSFFPIGEEVIFAGRLNRYARRITDQEKRIEVYKKWFDWNVSATKWLRGVHARFVKEIVFDNFSDKSAQEKCYFIPPELVGDTSTSKVPVFFQGDKE